MKKLFLILFLFPLLINAQDKLFFNDGKTAVGIVLGMGKDIVFFKNSDTSIVVRQIKKADLMMIETYKGTRYLFSESTDKDKEGHSLENVKYRNTFGAQPFGLLMGRGTLVYEHLTRDGKIGVAFPLSITYAAYKNALDSATKASVHLNGVNFIGGVDINFYVGKEISPKFFIGPRFRYGTDMILGTEAYTLQTQIGFCFGEPDERFVQHLSVGFGFAKLFYTTSGAINPDNAHTWFSVNYRLGIKW